MHCWKTINIKKEYGSTWLTIMAISLFIIVFALSFILFGRVHPTFYRDDYFWLFTLCFVIIYPVHKLLHYFTLFEYRRSVKLRVKIDYKFIPIIRLRIKSIIPKNRYVFTLLMPFIVINGLLIFFAASYEEYVHYFSLLLGYHCSICLIDFLYIKNLIRAPKNSVIEETPKGCEILVQSII
ncbi:DUF3267 domain-containing protein [Lysinibacillus sp. SGAir0095]|uniref:DUF3267 domain-containing protein n=1 Tax=Lysinibacillus sp. SGAir0095 TaxID=2070463 RepID=UPI0010CCD2E4|nr:DUF3267 domain-containing protein [Lysinibacillus sp. SGAir0095]QCR33661.1 DUF3267 domain-containing protein [Lysinibacillus sp. SGAir0095]